MAASADQSTLEVQAAQAGAAVNLPVDHTLPAREASTAGQRIQQGHVTGLQPQAAPVPWRDGSLPAGTLFIADSVWAPAGFGLRLRAFLIDFVILSLLGAFLQVIVKPPAIDPLRELELTGQVLQLALDGKLPGAGLSTELSELGRAKRFTAWLSILLYAAYFILFHGLASATPGKAVCGLRVFQRDGRPLGPGKASLRYLVYLLGARFFYGCFTMPFDSERRALHDLACGSNVFRELRWR